MTDDSQDTPTQQPNPLLILIGINTGIKFQNAGKFKKALRCFLYALEADSNQVNVWYRVGNCWQNLGYFEDAIASYNACYQRSLLQQNIWSQAASQFCLGQCYVSLQQQDQAIIAYRLAYQLFSQFENNLHTQQAWDYLNKVGNGLLNNQKFELAIQYYQSLVKVVKPRNNIQNLALVWHGLGMGFYGENLDELAIECHRQMLDISQRLSDVEMENTALQWLTYETWRLGQVESAINYFKQRLGVIQRLQRPQEQQEILDWIIKGYKQLNQLENTIDYYQQKLELLREKKDFLTEYQTLYDLGGVSFNLKQSPLAIDCFQAALNLEPSLEQPYHHANLNYMLGLIYYDLSQSSEAIVSFEKAVIVYEQQEQSKEWLIKALEYLEKLYQQTEDFEKLIAVLEKRLTRLRESEDRSNEYLLLYQIAGLYYKLQNYSLAKNYYKSALGVTQGLMPRQPGLEANAYYMLGLVCHYLKKWEEGLLNYREALKFYIELNNQEWVEHSRNKVQELEKILASPSTISVSQYDPQLDFLLDVLQVVADSNSDPKVVYPLLAQNLDKLDENSILKLQKWATAMLHQEETLKVINITRVIREFGDLLKDFPLGNRRINLEIAITCYEICSTVFSQSDFAEDWAITQINLGTVYLDRIKGEKAENIEKAIACYNRAFSIITCEDFPKNWAKTNICFGDAYRERIRGEKAENIETAITCYTNALSVLTRDNFSQNWAATQNSLGLTYRERVRGEKAENIETAITCYTNALSVFTRDSFSQYWAMIQMNLGNAYLDRIKEKKAENIEKAINCYTNALSILTRDNFPQYWAMAQDSLGNAYCECIKEGKPENIEKAINCYTNALSVLTYESFPKHWAGTQINLGNAYSERIKGEKAGNLEDAIACYTNALSVLTRTAFPKDWALTNMNLGNAYSKRIKGEKADNLEDAITFYTNALLVYNCNNLPQDWALTNMNLGIAYKNRIKGKKLENVEDSITYLNLALLVYNCQNFPLDWAKTQNNLGTAYTDRIKGEKAENLENAITCYKAALLVYTKENFLESWAGTQINLGYAYLDRIRGKKAENLETAIDCYRAALSIYTRESFPEYWAGAKMSLGIAYNNRIKGEKSKNIEIAIAYYTAVLSVYTQEGFAEYWARTQNNLGSAYWGRIEGEKADNVEIAISFFEATLKIYTCTAFPEEWAASQYNLGNGYSHRVKGEKAENLDTAITYYTNALSVRTREAFPYDYVVTSFNLGLAYQESQQWQFAYDTFYNAIETVEEIRAGIVKGGDADKQKLAEEWQKLYERMVEVCIELKNYTAAIEYVERSKTRNLVELLATRDLYPKGDIPQTVFDELDRLRRDIETEQRRLEIEERSRNSFTDGTTGERSANITALQTSPPDRSRLNELQEKLDELITREITPIDPDFRLTQKVQPIPFRDIQGLTGENTAILEWYILGDRFLTFIVTPEPPSPRRRGDGGEVTLWQSTPEDYNALIQWANDYLTAYRTNRNEWKNTLTARLQRLGEILHFDELLNAIGKKCDHLVLIPNRFLHLFPLHAIPINKLPHLNNGGLGGSTPQKDPQFTYLMNLFPSGVSYAPSCQLLQTAKNRQRPDFSHLFAIQNPTQDLTYTDLEVNSIRAYFDPSCILPHEKATKSKFDDEQQTTLKTAHCNHFSCHGYFNFENPLLSALLLANCYLEPPPSPVDPSRHLPLQTGQTLDLSQCLTLGDAFTLDLRSCRLVTLSACETGLIDLLSKSDEYIGLPSGFLVAGATNVVSSLWTVSDISTALLMIRFYQLLHQGEEVAIALNTAQNWLRSITTKQLLEWIQELPLDIAQTLQLEVELEAELEDRVILEDKPFASPYYWAAFCAIGKL